MAFNNQLETFEATACVYGYVPFAPEGSNKPKTCVRIPESELTFIPGCASYSGKATCASCEVGYFYKELTNPDQNRASYCQKVITHIPGCSTFSHLTDGKYCSYGCDWKSGYMSVDTFATKGFTSHGQICYNA
jgi:hypothetical protein